jgi:copper chaperone CopZ
MQDDEQYYLHTFYIFVIYWFLPIAFYVSFGVFYYGKYFIERVCIIMKKIIEVTGMHCTHCSKSVADALGKIDGVTKAKADHEKCTATVTMKSDIDDKILIETIENLGFTPGEITIKEGIFG